MQSEKELEKEEEEERGSEERKRRHRGREREGREIGASGLMGRRGVCFDLHTCYRRSLLLLICGVDESELLLLLLLLLSLEFQDGEPLEFGQLLLLLLEETLHLHVVLRLQLRLDEAQIGQRRAARTDARQAWRQQRHDGPGARATAAADTDSAESERSRETRTVAHRHFGRSAGRVRMGWRQ